MLKRETINFDSKLNKPANNKKKKILCVFISITILFLALGIYGFHINKQAHELISIIKETNIPISEVESKYKSLTKIGQSIYREDILSEFKSKVSNNKYKANDDLVNEYSISDYKMLKQLSIILELSSNEAVVKHIDAILELEQYIKYNDIYKMIDNSNYNYSEFNEAFEKLSDYSVKFQNGISSYYSSEDIIQQLKDALKHITDTIKYAEQYNTGNYLCNQYLSSLKTIKSEVEIIYYGTNYSSGYGFASSVSTVNNIISEVESVKNNVSKTIKSVPDF